MALVETGSVTKAAAALHMSQPALSHQIASLERELGTPVVERLSRGVRVTAAGLAAAAEARVALRAAERAVQAGRDVAAGGAGRLRLACAETMTVWLLVPVLRRWRPSRSRSSSTSRLCTTRRTTATPPGSISSSPRTRCPSCPSCGPAARALRRSWRGAGMGVSIVPTSALTAQPGGVVRPLEPRVYRGVVAVAAAPSDALVSLFLRDLRRRGLPGPIASV